jgi:hypothetical protein
MRIAVLGNCQAELIGPWLKASAPGLEIESMPFSFAIKKEQEAEIYKIFDRCDFIFCQRVADTHPCTFIRTSVLKNRYGDRAVSWPNAYFDGCFPGLCYIRDVKNTKILGPLDEYHFDFVFNAYIEGVSVEACTAMIEGDGVFEKHPDPVEQSLGQLRMREEGLHDNLTRARMFYTMNHPYNNVITTLVARLLNKAGLERHMPSDPFPWMLDRIIIGMFPGICRRYGLIDDQPCFQFKGVGMVAENGIVLNVPNSEQACSPRELIESYYCAYRETGITRKALLTSDK